MTQLPDGAAAVWAVATRISPLDATGAVDAGTTTYVTNQLIKATITPVVTTGDDIELKGASGELVVAAKHGDIPKYYTVSIELGTPDPNLEAALCGGTVYNDTTTAALGAPATPTVAAVTGPTSTLGNQLYAYKTTFYNTYGEGVPSAEMTVTPTANQAVIVEPVEPGFSSSSALGIRVYGRNVGVEQLIGTIPNIDGPALATAGTAALVAGATQAIPSQAPLTKAIPIGTTFIVSATTAVWTVTQYGAPGSSLIYASPDVTQAAIAGTGNPTIIPVFVDNGSVTPSGGGAPTTDTSAGPGAVGYQAPALLSVANPTGVSVEFWSKAIVNGYQAAVLPYFHWVLPRVANSHRMPLDLTNAAAQSIYEGQAFQNSNWGSGGANDFPFDTTKVFQRARCGAQVLPAGASVNSVGVVPVGAPALI